MKKISGFTLMELMVVIAIILLLSIGITATLSVSFEKAKKSKAMTEMAGIVTACKMFYKDTGAWPNHVAYIFYYPGYGYNQYGNGWLYFDATKFKGPYLMTFKAWSEVLDPWNQVYELFLDNTSEPYKLYVRSVGSSINDSSKRLKVLVHKFRKS